MKKIKEKYPIKAFRKDELPEFEFKKDYHLDLEDFQPGDKYPLKDYGYHRFIVLIQNNVIGEIKKEEKRPWHSLKKKYPEDAFTKEDIQIFKAAYKPEMMEIKKKPEIPQHLYNMLLVLCKTLGLGKELEESKTFQKRNSDIEDMEEMLTRLHGRAIDNAPYQKVANLVNELCRKTGLNMAHDYGGIEGSEDIRIYLEAVLKELPNKSIHQKYKVE